MATKTITHETTLTVIECANCGMLFAVSQQFEKELRNTHTRFYCPRGHNNYYPDETEEEKLRKEIAKQNTRIQWWNEYATEIENKRKRKRKQTERSLAATKGVVARIRNRVSNGVCPYCNRTFSNLARHMNCKHLDFKDEPTE